MLSLEDLGEALCDCIALYLVEGTQCITCSRGLSSRLPRVHGGRRGHEKPIKYKYQGHKRRKLEENV